MTQLRLNLIHTLHYKTYIRNEASNSGSFGTAARLAEKTKCNRIIFKKPRIQLKKKKKKRLEGDMTYNHHSYPEIRDRNKH